MDWGHRHWPATCAACSGLTRAVICVEPSATAARALRQRWQAGSMTGMAVVEAAAQELQQLGPSLGLASGPRQFNVVVDKVRQPAAGAAGHRQMRL